MVEYAFAATDLGEDFGFVGRALLGKEPGEGIDDAFFRRHHAAAIGPAEVVGAGTQRERVEARVLAERGGDMLVERAAVPLGRWLAGEDARLRPMTAADAGMLKAGDDGEAVAKVCQRSEILGHFVAGSRLLRDEGIAVNAERQTDEQQAARFLAGFGGMGDTAKGFEPGQAEGDAGAAEESAAGGEGGLGVHVGFRKW